MIAVIDYGVGNINSIRNMILRIDHRIAFTCEPRTLLKAEKLILPGVGSFDDAIKKMRQQKNLIKSLNQVVLESKIPILGICLGMQLMGNSSEEGELPGLGWINAKSKIIPKTDSQRIPIVGWHRIHNTRENALTYNLNESFFYFSNSFHLETGAKVTAAYSLENKLSTVVNQENIWGVQFHPEKSNENGLKLFRNFLEI